MSTFIPSLPNRKHAPDYTGEVLPPEIEQAELILLYCISINPEILRKLSAWLFPEDFINAQWRDAYWAAQAIGGRGELVTLQSIAAELQLAGKEPNTVKLAQIADPVPGSVIVDYGYETLACIIKEASRRRQCLYWSSRSAQASSPADVEKAAKELLRLSREAYPPAPIKPVLPEDKVAEAPELPVAVRLSPADEAEASRVGGWLNEFVDWAALTANQTPHIFLEASGLFLGAVAIGRRLHINAPWGDTIYPNLYIMMVAVSTFYRKSVGLNIAKRFLDKAMPHMRLANPGSPESFKRMLAGQPPSNFEKLRQADQDHFNQGARFAAQRGVFRDELSGLFKSMGRDYMAGMKELLMELYDCPDLTEEVTQTQGAVIIRNAALSLAGATTPAELSFSITPGDWQNGHLARFALLTPEPDYEERPDPETRDFPHGLVDRLRSLHTRLPAPPAPATSDDDQPAESWSLVAPIWKRAQAYQKVLRDWTNPHEKAIDDRLRAVYGRLHVQALKMTIILAGMDWADNQARPDRPVVTVAHWCRAQQIAEAWRRSAHVLLDQLNVSLEGEREESVLQALKKTPEGLSARDIYKSLRLPSKDTKEALHRLVEDGIAEEFLGSGARRAILYRLRDQRFG